MQRYIKKVFSKSKPLEIQFHGYYKNINKENIDYFCINVKTNI